MSRGVSCLLRRGRASDVHEWRPDPDGRSDLLWCMNCGKRVFRSSARGVRGTEGSTE